MQTTNESPRATPPATETKHAEQVSAEKRISALLARLERQIQTRPTVWRRDAALPVRGPESFTANLQPFATALNAWEAVIAQDHCFDQKIDSLKDLDLDARDGAITRGRGGLGYTNRAWSQLIALFQAGQPGNAAAVSRWETTLGRATFFGDLQEKSRRTKGPKGAAVLRLFQARVQEGTETKTYPAIRAVVSVTHGLEGTDDLAVVKVLRGISEEIELARFTREWDTTRASFVLRNGGTEDEREVALALGFVNSETGAASLAFTGSIQLRALQAQVLVPGGEAARVAVARASTSTKGRRHTLPRRGADGRLLTSEERAEIGQERILSDVEAALEASRALASRWEPCKAEINPTALALSNLVRAAATQGDEAPVAVFRDWLAENGYQALVENAPELAAIFGSGRVALPAGSAAEMAASVALLAQDLGARITWERAAELQELAGRLVLFGW